jgi:lipopolysaccharide biosynthesis glycosyltransferase
MANTDSPDLLDIHILDGGIPDELFDLIARKLDRQYPYTNLNRHKLNLSKFEGLKRFYGNSHLPYARLLAPHLIGAQRAIYLDVDLLCLGDIKEFAEIDFESHSVVASKDKSVSTLANDCPFEAPPQANTIPYFNSGVMHIDLEAWRKENIGEKVLKMLKESPGSFPLVDQTALNWHFQGKFKLAPQVWNISPDGISEVQEPDSVKILHYTSQVKPWQALPIALDYKAWHRAWHHYIGSDLPKRYNRKCISNSAKRLKIDLLKASPFLRSLYLCGLSRSSSKHGERAFLKHLGTQETGYSRNALKRVLNKL